MIIGYARTSTVDQISSLEVQVKELKAVGCKKIYKEQASSIAARGQLQAALDFVRETDTFMVTKLDRLARSITDLMEIVKTLERKQVGLRVLNLGMDTSTPTGKLMLTVLGGVAQFEREMMLERQREGVAKAKEAGKYKGRKPVSQDRVQEVIRLAKDGIKKRKIAALLKLGEATIYRILAAKNGAEIKSKIP